MSRRTAAAAAPRAGFRSASWHGWWVCKDCGALAEDWGLHSQWHTTVARLADAVAGGQADAGGDGLEDLAARARAEGHAVVEASAWREGLRQAREVFRLRHTQAAR